ncbi:MAG: hypothetical protein COA32_10260 [Fluviicola sp.]|nr:MAG: hypothetical protein COA32_10260 [Fluviicola sp.]
MKRQQNKTAFFITLFYWAVSSYSLFSVIYQFENHLHFIVEALSLPATYIGFSVWLGGAHISAVIIAQILSFLVFYYLIKIVVQLVYVLILAIKGK